MTTHTLEPSHPVLACLANVAGELKGVRAAQHLVKALDTRWPRVADGLACCGTA